MLSAWDKHDIPVVSEVLPRDKMVSITFPVSASEMKTNMLAVLYVCMYFSYYYCLGIPLVVC